ncbi:SctK family type III secretion system sorting platform protein [Nitratireductor pacificus]|nr:SctK family type III secretion system sorting platform protein [Nitratireductor pacificus]
MDDPADYARPGRLAACFDGAIGIAACADMLAAERLRPRLTTLLLSHYDIPRSFPAGQVDEKDRRVALATREELQDIVLRAGAIRWAGSFAGIIMSADAAALNAVLGTDLSGFAMANRDLSGPVRPIEDLDGLPDRLTADGWRCLAAWCRAVPQAVGARVRLRLEPEEMAVENPIGDFAEAGPIVIRRAVG